MSTSQASGALVANPTNVHLAVSWAGNAVAYLLGGMSPLQGILVITTLAFTVLQAVALWRREFKDKEKTP